MGDEASDAIDKTYEMHVWDDYAKSAVQGLAANPLAKTDEEIAKRAANIANCMMRERKRRGVPHDLDPLVYVDEADQETPQP